MSEVSVPPGATDDVDFALAAYREEGVWQVQELAHDVLDNLEHLANALRHANDYLFTTGGIGPTHDDITVDSIAAALGVPAVVHPSVIAASGRRSRSRCTIAGQARRAG